MAEEKTQLEIAEERRAARKAEARADFEKQLAADLEAIDALEIEHGDSNVAVIRLPHTPGLPAAVACRCPKPAEVKRFRVRLKPKHEKDHPDQAAAVEELAASCLIYPTRELYEQLCAARPGLAVQLGKKATDLSTGNEEAEGKG